MKEKHDFFDFKLQIKRYRMIRLLRKNLGFMNYRIYALVMHTDSKDLDKLFFIINDIQKNYHKDNKL